MNVTNSLENYPPITGKESGSFAHFTIEKRLPSVIDNIISDNSFSKKINNELLGLKKSVLSGKADIPINSGPDQADWNNYILPFKNLSFFELPFYFAEAYFYRLILDKTEYFTNAIDPFGKLKEKDAAENLKYFDWILSQSVKVKSENDLNNIISFLLQISLWGNKSDLSQLSLNRNLNDSIHKNNLLIDHTDQVRNLLQSGIDQAAIILDNSGMELFTDLVTALALIQNKFVKKITLFAKAYPTFVSDATENDLDFLLKICRESGEGLLIEFAGDFRQLISDGIISVISDPFWNTPLHFFQMSSGLMEKLQTSDLLIFKGDANYRRIFSDKHLPRNINPKEFTRYLPSKSLAVRILKSEIITGMNDMDLLQLDSSDKDWLSNGKYGIIQVLN